ncbi:MAG: LysE family translocator [Pseudomonadota bacterium]
MELGSLIIILTAWIIGAGSPGPATLAISATAMEHGRKAGVIIASGIVAGSACWGIAAGLGISSLMLANVWLFELVRYLGAAYLLYLAIKSLKSAFGSEKSDTVNAPTRRLFAKGMLLHLTNPKAILGWGSVYAIALPPDANAYLVAELFCILIVASVTVFIGYGCLFSMNGVSRFYRRSKRWFELAFGLLFGAASLRLLTSRVDV